MGKQDKPKHDSPERDETLSLDPLAFLERTKTGKPSSDASVEALQDNKRNIPKALYDKADAFLRKHSGISYEEFLRQTNPEEFTGNDYRNLEPQERRRRFERYAASHLVVLADVEEKGYDVGVVFERLEEENIEVLKVVYEKIKKRKNRQREQGNYLESLVSEVGEIFERYVKSGDGESLYASLRDLSPRILDQRENLPPEKQGVVDVLYYHLYGIEKFMESQSENIS